LIEPANISRPSLPKEATPVSFVIAAMRNRTFLCAAMVVNAVIMILADMSLERLPLWHLWDISEWLILLLGIAYLRVADDGDEFRELIKAFLFYFPFLLVVAHTFG